MRIAFIVGVFPSLSETFILNQITGLLELGHDVEIFSLLRSKEDKRHEIIDRLNLMERVHFFPLIPKNSFLRLIKGKYLFFKNFYKDPKKLIRSVNFLRRDKDILSLKVLYYLAPFLGKKFNIIHSHFGHIGNIGVYLRKGGIEGKLVTTFYGYDLSTFIAGKDNNIYKKLFSYGDLFLPICKYFKKKLINLSFEKGKIKLLPIGIDFDKHGYTKRVRGNGAVVKILTAGRMIEKKGYLYSLKAVKELHLKNRKIIYTIIGDGPLMEELKELVFELDLKNIVKFTGSINRGELLEYYKESDIFLLPSIIADNGDEEGTPAVLIEAQASGLPVVSTFHSGIPEIVVHERSGFLAVEKDVGAISEYLDILVTDLNLREKMGEYGRKFVEKNFDIKKLSLILEGYYTELLKK